MSLRLINFRQNDGIYDKDSSATVILQIEKARKKMNNLAKDISSDFFAGNIGSLLDVALDVSRVEIKRSLSGNFLHEEINFIFR